VTRVVAIAARGLGRVGLVKGVLLPVWRCRFAAEDSGWRIVAPNFRWD